MQKTDWFSSDTLPPRRGWYEIRGVFIDAKRGSGGVVMRYWNGRRWFWNSTFTGKKSGAAVGGADKWRGLVTPNV